MDQEDTLMKKIFLLLCLSGCSTTFFGGRVVGPYIKQYNGQMECAFVEGWAKDIVCRCHIVSDSFSKDKTFLEAPEIMCKETQ